MLTLPLIPHCLPLISDVIIRFRSFLHFLCLSVFGLFSSFLNTEDIFVITVLMELSANFIIWVSANWLILLLLSGRSPFLPWVVFYHAHSAAWLRGPSADLWSPVSVCCSFLHIAPRTLLILVLPDSQPCLHRSGSPLASTWVPVLCCGPETH